MAEKYNMAIIKHSEQKEKKQSEPDDKSIIVTNSKIDRDGNGWEKKPFWFRQEYLGKLKALAHFENKSTQKLIDEALGEYIKKNWDNSKMMKKIVSKSVK